jgi:hypothetical protein
LSTCGVFPKLKAQPMSNTVQEVLPRAAPTFYSEGHTGEQQTVVTVLNPIYEEDLLGFFNGSDPGVNHEEEAELDFLPQAWPSLSTRRGIPDFNSFGLAP